METLNINYPACPALGGDCTKAIAEPVIVLPTCKGIMVIPVQQIIRIQSISNYSKLFFRNASPATGGGKTLVVAKVLRWFEERLSPPSTVWREAGGEGFIRIHRTHLINPNYIKTYRGSKSGLLLLSNGEMFSVAKRKKASLAVRLNNLNISFAEASAYTSTFNNKKILAA
jgi:DNA-binding LytR/AlgR family response regulator